jgi:hypothetical protein
MRGDSLRDFYAKALALMGLALLGLVGAAVEYWPTAAVVPQPAVVAWNFDELAPRPAPDMPELPVPSEPARRPDVVLVRTADLPSIAIPAVNPAVNPDDLVRRAFDPPADPPVADMPPAITVAAAAPDPLVPVPVVPTPNFQLTTVATSDVIEMPVDRPGFFGRTKRATNAFLQGSARTGLIVAEAVQTAGGAVSGAVSAGVRRVFGSK